MKALLECSNLRKTYREGTQSLEVLKGIDLAIAEGTVSAIAGPSGAGKSTLLHLLGGLDEPTAGQVVFEGKDFYRLPARQQAALRNRSFGFVFQFYYLLPELTALENVVLPGWMRNGSPLRELRAQARTLLEGLGLGDRLSHYPGQLSGGEQQRVAIARALINRPRVVLCDEPTGNLDSETGHQVLKLLRERNKKAGTTFLIVTHDQRVSQIADSILRLKDGRIV